VNILLTTTNDGQLANQFDRPAISREFNDGW